MSDDERVRELVEEALNGGRSPEEVCAEWPELLPEVRRRWLRVRDLAEDIERAFPSNWPGPSGDAWRALGSAGALPDIPGYELTALIGQGGMGVVYKARHIKLGREVAIKMTRAGDFSSARELAGLVREAQSVAGLSHPHIVQVYDVGELRGLPYFTMELVEGGSLAKVLAGQPQTAARAAELLSALAGAAHAAHSRGIVHRDLKPANVLIGADGTPKITDFGLARRAVPGGETLTMGGARVGTPSYMSPEQALGTAGAFEPTTDVYSLGAILYEVLTGRPPFRGESATDTERQLLSDDPVRPSRLNPKTPRDLETICLRCLEKSPDRRYRTALELAEDIGRFRRGEPIRARPAGIVERAAKWGRRHPAQVVMLCSGLLVIALGFAGGLWYQNMMATRRAEATFRQAEARRIVGADLEQAGAAIAAEDWSAADRALAHARERFAEASSGDQEKRVSSLAGAVGLARELEQARESRVSPLKGMYDLPSVVNGYEAVFRKAKIDLGGDPHASAAAIRASPIAAQWVAALDDWAIVDYSVEQSAPCDEILAVAREADPGSAWRDRFRDREVWRDREALLELATEAEGKVGLAGGPTAQQIGLLGLRFRAIGAPDVAVDLIRRTLMARPTDFWMNWELGRLYLEGGKYREATSPLRAAVAIRPDNLQAWDALAGTLCESGDLDEGIPIYNRVLADNPGASSTRRNLVFILCKNGRWREAEAAYRGWGKPDAQGLAIRKSFVNHLLRNMRYGDALAVLQELRRDGSADDNVFGTVGECLFELGRVEEAQAIVREWVRTAPENPKSHAWLNWTLFRADRIDESIVEGREALGRSFKLASLQTPFVRTLLARGHLAEAADVAKRLADADPTRTSSWITLARAQLGLRQFAEARESLDRTKRLYASPGERAELDRLDKLQARVAELERVNPGLLTGAAPAADPNDLLEAAMWNSRCAAQPLLGSRQFDAAFAAQPNVASNAGARVDAACAALGAADPPPPANAPSPAERQALRSKAFAWLASERDALLAKRERADGPGRIAIAAEFRAWVDEPALATSRSPIDPDVTPEERGRWKSWWAGVAKDAALDDPMRLYVTSLAAARLSEWPRARDGYAELFRIEPKQDGERQFEFAALQALSGDMEGYRQTCQEMVAESAAKPPRVRPYHAARAGTLAPLPRADATRLYTLARDELTRSSDAAWACTEAAAILYRAGQADDAIVQLKRSLEFDSTPGMAVIDWLWLALAHGRAGHRAEARLWFARADAWLGHFDNEMPSDNSPSSMHFHNWLEAQVLRREASALLATPDDRSRAPEHP